MLTSNTQISDLFVTAPDMAENGEIESGLVNIIATNNGQGIFREVLGRLTPYELDYEIYDMWTIKLYDNHTLFLLRKSDSDTLLYPYFDGLPTNNAVNPITLSEAAIGLYYINTPTETIIIFSGGEMRHVKYDSVAGIYKIEGHVITGYPVKPGDPTIKQIVSINSTYVLHNGTNTIALSDAIVDNTAIEATNIINVPMPYTEKIVELRVNKSSLYIFTTNYKIEYAGIGDRAGLKPITFLYTSPEKFSLYDRYCSVSINDVLYALGTKDNGRLTIYTLNRSGADMLDSSPSATLDLKSLGESLYLEQIIYNNVSYAQVVGLSKNFLLEAGSPRVSEIGLFSGKVDQTNFNLYTRQFMLGGIYFFLCKITRAICSITKSGDIPTCAEIVIQTNFMFKHTIDIYYRAVQRSWRVEIYKEYYKELRKELKYITSAVIDRDTGSFLSIQIQQSGKMVGKLHIKFIQEKRNDDIEDVGLEDYILNSKTLILKSVTLKRELFR